jgi:hypothetical protein
MMYAILFHVLAFEVNDMKKRDLLSIVQPLHSPILRIHDLFPTRTGDRLPQSKSDHDSSSQHNV